MKVEIRSNTFIVSALQGSQSVGFEVNGAVTHLLMTQLQIPIDEMRGVSALRPYIKIRFINGDESLYVAVRFQCLKDDQVVHSTILDRQYSPEYTLIPDDVPDLTPYQTRNRLLGRWSLTVDVGLFASTLLKQFSDDANYRSFLAHYRYQRINTFNFEVIRNTAEIALTPTGRMINARQETNTTYTLNDL